MLKEFLNAWSGGNLRRRAFQNAKDMFQLDRDVFQLATQHVFDSDQIEAVRRLDQQVNDKEIEIRKLIVEHLTLNPKQDTSSCLSLITVAKDLERIGDYSKSIAKLKDMYGGPLPKDDWATEFLRIRDVINTRLQGAARAFMDADEDLAKNVLVNHKELSAQCKDVIERLLQDDSLTPRQAVVYTLMSRYLKRVNAHTSNIITTVSNPFHMVGRKYYEFEDDD
jgi:phosphate uptake regulator